MIILCHIHDACNFIKMIVMLSEIDLIIMLDQSLGLRSVIGLGIDLVTVLRR